MQLPDEFIAAAETYPISGMGGRNRGEYELEGSRGAFTRIESRFAAFDPLFVANRGKSSFSLAGPDLVATVSAECSFRENVLNIGPLTFDPEKLTYVCVIDSGDASLNGELKLGEPKPRSLRERTLAQAIRVGEARLGSFSVGIESVHRYRDTRLVSDVPTGYLLTLDGELAAAIELTDVNPTIMVLREIAEPSRLALLSAAMALAILRDPANSALGD